jgi:flagellar motor switch protein FliM
MQAMSQVAGRFSRSARRTLPWLARAKSRLLPKAVSIINPAEELGDAGNGPAFDILLEAEEAPAWASITIDSLALRYVLDGALGAKMPGAGELGSELTLAQRAVVARVARSMADDFIAAVREEVGLTFVMASARARSAHDSVELPGADGLRVDCVMEGMQDEPAIAIVVSAEALEAAAREHHEEVPVAADPRMEEALRDVTVDVRVELGKVVLGLRSVMELRPGQVIRLLTAADDPATVFVGGIAKYAGRPVVSRGQLAVEIRGRLDA